MREYTIKQKKAVCRLILEDGYSVDEVANFLHINRWLADLWVKEMQTRGAMAFSDDSFEKKYISQLRERYRLCADLSEKLGDIKQYI